MYQQAGVQYAKSIDAVFSLRVNNTNNHFGNPFSNVESEIQKGLIRTKSTRESVEKYIDWVLSPTTNIKPEQHTFIREQLLSGELKGKSIIYYKELGEPSHATALDYLINKYDWNNQINENNDSQTNQVQEDNSNKTIVSSEEKTNFMGYNGYISIRDNNLKSFIDGNPSDAYLVVNKNKTDLKDINISNLSADEIIRIIKCKM